MSDAVAALERALAGLVDAVAGVSPGWLVLGVALHLANQVARGRGVVRRGAHRVRPSQRRRAGVTCSPRGSRAREPAASCPRAAATPCACCVLARRMPGEGKRALLTGTLVAETAGETALGAALLALALAFGVGPSLGPSTTTVLYVARRRARAHRRGPDRPPHPARARVPDARRLRLLGAALAAPLRARRAAVAARSAACCGSPRSPASSPPSTCPATLGRDPARHVRAVRRAARAVLARRGRRGHGDPRRLLRAGHRHRGAGLAARRVLRRHEHGADRGRHRAGAGDLREERGSGLGERRAEAARCGPAA